MIPLFAWVEAGLIVKLAFSLYFVAQGTWARTVVEEEMEKA